jgi:lipopolysaccharide heptosyltransferase II
MNAAPPKKVESRSVHPWDRIDAPGKILIIRFHAFGDVALTLPASLGLRERFPDSEIDFLTLGTAAPLLRSVRLFNRVLEFPSNSNRATRLMNAVRFGMLARSQHYDVVIDLQRNRISRMVRQAASCPAWSEFDRFGPLPAAERTLSAIHDAGFNNVVPSHAFTINETLRVQAESLLSANGYQFEKRLVVLNPAGLWKTRNWPLNNYLTLARLWQEHEPVQFLLLGTGRIQQKAEMLRQRLGPAVIDLTGKTTVDLAFALLQNASAIVTEDSGLMHLAWCAQLPIVALFGSSNAVWSAPTGKLANTLHSGDLLCGGCMQPECMYGDTHCLSRYSPEKVFQIATELTRTFKVTAVSA